MRLKEQYAETTYFDDLRNSLVLCANQNDMGAVFVLSRLLANDANPNKAEDLTLCGEVLLAGDDATALYAFANENQGVLDKSVVEDALMRMQNQKTAE